MLRQTNAFRRNQSVAERVLDSNDLECEQMVTLVQRMLDLHRQHTAE